MRITKKNYEEYALDYLEGNLNESDQREFLSFLSENPDIHRELEELELIEISPELVKSGPEFRKKGELHRDTPVIALLKAPVRIKIWQAAAAIVLLFSVAWGVNSYYLNSVPYSEGGIVKETNSGVEEINEGSDAKMAVDVPATSGEEKIASAANVSQKNDNETVTEVQKAEQKTNAANEIVEDNAGNGVGSIAENEVDEISDEIIALDDQKEVPKFVKLELESPHKLNRNEISLLASPDIRIDNLNKKNERFDRGDKDLAEVTVDVEIEIDEQEAGSFLTRLVERVVPPVFSDWVGDSKVEINKNKIPDPLLPEYVKQKSL